MLFWSQTTFPGRPRVLIVDAFRNAQGWEQTFCDRIFYILHRKGLRLVGESPLRVQHPAELVRALEKSGGETNALLLFAHGPAQEDSPEEGRLAAFWDRLSRYEDLKRVLLVACSGPTYDAATNAAILDPVRGVTPLAVAPQSALGQREAGLFLVKFFAELDLHSFEDTLTGKMTWFAYKKAKYLVGRRNLPGDWGVRC